jgi:HD-like signal output (HDOD) protein
MGTQLHQPDLNRIVDSIDRVASLPDVTVRLIEAANDPRSDAFRLLKIVSHDPALVARILKLVNSSYYGLSTPVASLAQGIALLGIRTVRNLAVATSLAAMFRGGELCAGFRASDLWTHSIAVAVAARELSQSAALSITDDAFMVGMLHDLGLLAVHEKFPDELRRICDDAQATGRNFCELEREELGFDHPQLGGAMARHWKFPDPVRCAIEFHHAPAECPSEHVKLATLIYLADTLCCQTNEGFTLTAPAQPIEDAIAVLGLSPDLIIQIRENLPALIARASPFKG